jgi:Asp-tRNA(Asn)/Glu-tRNA(Gln) amidotransferase A subunit family amidase
MAPGFTVPGWDGSLLAGRIEMAAADEVDPRITAAVNEALALAGVTVQSAATWDFRPAADAAGVLIDAAGFKVNAYLMPYIDQLSPHIARNLERGARLRQPAIADAERAREVVRARFAALLVDFPVLVMPTLTGQPPLLGHRGIMLTQLTAPVSLAGLPALSLPVPAPDGVIASLQVIGESEERVLAFGKAIESALAAPG